MCWKQISEGASDSDVPYQASKLTSFLGNALVRCAIGSSNSIFAVNWLASHILDSDLMLYTKL
jgi:hypothetical protein